MTKRTLAIVLAALMIVAMFAGCNSGSPAATTAAAASTTKAAASTTKAAATTAAAAATTAAPAEPAADYGDTGGLVLPIVDERIDITWLTAHDNVQWEDNPFVQEIFNRTGIYINIMNVPVDAKAEKVNTLLASRDLPEAMNIGIDQAKIYGEQGAFVKINEHYDLLPNYRAVIVDNPDNQWYLKSYSTDTGNVYTYPVMDLQRRVNHMYMYRKDIFEKNGIELWDNGETDKFYDAMVQLKQIYPNSYPVSSKMGNSFWYYNAAGWGLVAGQWPMVYFEDQGEWAYGFTTNEFRECLEFHTKLYAEGLLDPEFMTNTSADWIAKTAEPEKTFVYMDWISRMDLLEQQVGEAQPEFDLEAAPPYGPSGSHFPLTTLGAGGWVVSALSKYSLETLQLYDYFLSPSGGTLQSIGIEGDWFYFDENDVPVYTDPELAAKETIGIDDLSQKYGLWNQSMYIRTDRRALYHKLTPNEQTAQDVVSDDEILTPDPILAFNDQETEENSGIATDLNNKAFEMAMDWVMNGGDDAKWNAWLETAKQYGADDLVQNYNDAQVRYDAIG